MDAATRSLIEAIHRTPSKCVLALTGGGTTAAALLLGVPGASRSILEVIVPYDEHALTTFLGRRPDQFCSMATAEALASRARERGQWLAPGLPVVGVGSTASLATDRPKRGEHRFFLAVHSDAGCFDGSLVLHKGRRDREGEEEILDAALLNVLAEALEISDRVPVALLDREALALSSASDSGRIVDVIRGDLLTVEVALDGRLRADAPKPAVLIPGAFNPVHAGHWGLAEVAQRLLGRHASFELSVQNVDKPALTAAEVRRRVRQFIWKAPVWLTRAPTFVEKARLFPGAVFVVGADTAARIVDARYYDHDNDRVTAALSEICCLGNRFLVAGRQDATGRFVGLEELAIPPEFRDLFTPIPEAAFRVAVSSTELRRSSDPRP